MIFKARNALAVASLQSSTDISIHSHRLLWLDDNKSGVIVATGLM